jgi:Putative Ig domain
VVVAAASVAYAEPAIHLPIDLRRRTDLPAAPSAVAVGSGFEASAAAGVVSAAPPPAADNRPALVLETTRDAGVSFFYAVPCRAVDNCEPASTRKLVARTAEGGPLPDWLKFDANTGTFFGTAPLKTRTLKLKVASLGPGASFDKASAVSVSLNFAGGRAVP